MVALLTTYREVQDVERTQAGDDYASCDLVIATQSGLPVSARNLVRDFHRATYQAGVPRLRFHDMRHSHASLLLAGGANIRVIADRLGHSQVSFTMQVYTHAALDAQRESAEALSASILSKTEG